MLDLLATRNIRVIPVNYVENGLTDTDQRLNLAQDPYFGLAIGELPNFCASVNGFRW